MSRIIIIFLLKTNIIKKMLLIIQKSYFKQITAHYDIEGNFVSLNNVCS